MENTFVSCTLRSLSIAIQIGVPTLLVSEPGTAKTALVGLLLKENCVDHETCIAALYDPPYFGGYPIPGVVDGESMVHQVPNSWVLRLAKASQRGRVGLHLDELSSAPPATRAAALRGIHEGVWGEHHIPNLSVVASMNPADVAEGGFSLSAPLANRFFHLPWKPPIDWWCDQMLAGFPVPKVDCKVPKGWNQGKHMDHAAGLIASFHHVFSGRAQKMPDSEEERSKPWPSLRSWIHARDLMSAALAVGEYLPTPGEGDDAKESSGVIYQILCGTVGSGIAIEFMSWAGHLDLPDPEDLLAHPDRVKIPERGDQLYVTLNSVVSAVSARYSDERWTAAARVLSIAYQKSSAPACVAAFRPLMRVKGRTAQLPKELNNLVPMMKKGGLLDS